MPLVLLDELGVLEVLLGEVGRHLGDEEAGDGEPREEGPVAPPLPAEEDRPRVERLHLLRLRLARDRLPPPLLRLRAPASLLVRNGWGRLESVRPRRRRLRASSFAWWEGDGPVAIGLGLILMGCSVAAGLPFAQLVYRVV